MYTKTIHLGKLYCFLFKSVLMFEIIESNVEVE